MHDVFWLNHTLSIWLQIKFRQYIIKTQNSRLKTQDSRIKNEESTVHRQGSKAWPLSLASRPPIRKPMASGLRNRPHVKAFLITSTQNSSQSIQDLHHHHGQRMSLNITRILYSQSSKYLSFYYCKCYCKIVYKDWHFNAKY